MAMNPIKKRILFLIFFFSVTAFFLYVLFPSNVMKKYITYHLNKIRSDFSVSIDDVKTSFPFGIRLHDVDFYHLNMPLMNFKEIKISPKILPLFKLKTAFSLQGRAYEGFLSGIADFSRKQSQRRITVDVRLSDIQIRNIPALQNQFSHKVRGILQGEINYCRDGGKEGTAKAEFFISDGGIELLTPVFSMKDFTFEKIDTHVIFENQNLQIRKCVMKGMQMDGKIDGTILFKYPGRNSSLDLNGALNPHPLFLESLRKNAPASFFLKKRDGKNGLEFRIEGTVDHPEFSLN